MTKKKKIERGVDLIAKERERQVNTEGWSDEHDDSHDDQSLALAAALYATPIPLYEIHSCPTSLSARDPWPWINVGENHRGGRNETTAWDGRERHSQKRKLIIAGALIAAELDRIIRKELDI